MLTHTKHVVTINKVIYISLIYNLKINNYHQMETLMNQVKRTHIKITSAYILLSFLALLSGCAGDVNMLPTLTQKTKVSSNQGIVVVRIINASAYPLPFNQVTITPKNLNESKKIKASRLQAISAPTTNSTIFSAPATTGSYAFDSIRAFHTRGDYWYSRWAGADAKFGTFNVEPGKITDLGTIIYYPKPQEDKYLNTILRTPAREPAEVLSTYFPFYAFTPEQVINWTDDEYQEDRDALFNSVAQNPVTYNYNYLAPDNSLYLIGKLGVILKRTAEKEWRLDAVDTNLDLSAIVQSENGDLAVGGDEGIIYYKQQGGEWQNISLEKPLHVEELFFNEKGEIEVISRNETEVHVLEKQLTELHTSWQTKAIYSSVAGWKGASGENLIVSANKDQTAKSSKKKPKAKRIVSVVTNRESKTKTITIKQQSLRDNFAFATGEQTTFSFSPDSWQVSEFKSESNISRVFDAGTLKLGVEYAGFWSLTGRPTYYKKDLVSGDWQKISTTIQNCKAGYKILGKYCVALSNEKTRTKINHDRFTLTSIPWFSSNNEATAIASFSDYNFWSGKRSNETKIIKTKDGGKTWTVTQLALPNEYCTSLISKVKDSMLLSCNGVSSDFYESIDNGETWQHVKEQENF